MKSSVKYGQELGSITIRIAQYLLKNQNLCKLLINTDLEPLSPTHGEIENPLELLNKNLLVTPYVDPNDQTTESKVTIVCGQGSIVSNRDNEALYFNVGVYTPFKKWRIAGNDLRPYAIMSEIRKSIQDMRINGLGEIKYNGFSLANLTSQMGVFSMEFEVLAFS